MTYFKLGAHFTPLCHRTTSSMMLTVLWQQRRRWKKEGPTRFLSWQHTASSPPTPPGSSRSLLLMRWVCMSASKRQQCLPTPRLCTCSCVPPPGGGDQHDTPRAAEAPVSKDQNGWHQHDPVRGHPPHPQWRVHVLPVPQYRSRWLNSWSNTHTDTHLPS